LAFLTSPLLPLKLQRTPLTSLRPIHTIYDDNNRLSIITYPDNSTVRFKYDENGNVTEMADSLGTTRYVYDDLNRATSYTDAYGKAIGYEYDENGNVRVLIYPDGKRVTYGYDNGNRMISVTDWTNKVTRYEYDERDLVKKMTHANGTTASYTYDIAGRLTGLVNAKSDGTVISSYSFVLDKNGNRLNATIQEPLPPRIATPPQMAAFDEANRIKRASASTFTFDANGNMTGKTTSGVTTAFAYDFSDRLIAVGNTTQYFYNGVGVRLGKREGVKTTRYVVDVNRELSQALCETDGSGAITGYYVFGLGLISKVEAGGDQHYYHYDTLGSTVALTNHAQSIVNRYSFDISGKVISSLEAFPQPFQFVGRYGVMQEANGLQFMRARYYTPDIARFTSKDLVPGSLEESQSLNLFAYVGNNPISNIDPLGLFSLSDLNPIPAIKKTASRAYNATAGAVSNAYNATATYVANNFKYDRYDFLGDTADLLSDVVESQGRILKSITSAGPGAFRLKYTNYGKIGENLSKAAGGVFIIKDIVDNAKNELGDINFGSLKNSIENVKQATAEEWARAISSSTAVAYNTVIDSIPFNLGAGLKVSGDDIDLVTRYWSDGLYNLYNPEQEAINQSLANEIALQAHRQILRKQMGKKK
jgi:RHS repeat-associated protein